MDRRRRESRLIEAIRADLIAHVGSIPSATQKMLIERACSLSLSIALMDARTAAGQSLDVDAKSYLGWSNALSRTLKLLGLKAAAAAPPSLDDILARGRKAA